MQLVLLRPLPLQIINGQFVEGFYIYSRELGANGTYKMLTVLHGGGASACTMAGLGKYRQYEFFIVPFYKTVDGRPSNSRLARTLEDGKWGDLLLFVILCRSSNRSMSTWGTGCESGVGLTINQRRISPGLEGGWGSRRNQINIFGDWGQSRLKGFPPPVYD